MKISNDFPLLQQANSLFLVAGTQSAIIYRLSNGEIKERETITINNPEYTDREGHFEYTGPSGKLHGSGSVYEPKDEYVQKKFLGTLVEELKQIKQPFDSVYLFAPMHFINEIESSLPDTFAEKIKRKFTGNFTKLHPTELLAKVKELREFKAESEAHKRVSSEAAKILRGGSELPVQ